VKASRATSLHRDLETVCPLWRKPWESLVLVVIFNPERLTGL